MLMINTGWGSDISPYPHMWKQLFWSLALPEAINIRVVQIKVHITLSLWLNHTPNLLGPFFFFFKDYFSYYKKYCLKYQCIWLKRMQLFLYSFWILKCLMGWFIQFICQMTILLVILKIIVKWICFNIDW